MKKIRNLYFNLLFLIIVLLLFPSCKSTQAQANVSPIKNINITLNDESVRAIVDSFNKKTVTDQELSRFARLQGNQGLIQQAARFDSNATEENFKQSLKQIIETGKADKDPFKFERVKDRLEQIKSLLSQIEQDPQALTDSVTVKMLKYAPANLKLNVNVYLISGGTSDGFAPDAQNFYVALEFLKDDYEGLKLLMAHELFHNAQAVLRRPQTNAKQTAQEIPNIRQCLHLLGNTFDEGTASMVGDPLNIVSGGAWVNFFQTKYQHNLARVNANFALFEMMLYRLYNDRNMNSSYFDDRLYDIGFSGDWDSPLYFVGYRIGKIIEKYKGREAIVALIGKNPLLFFDEYIEIYKKHSDPEIVRFSKPVEDILQRLHPLKGNHALRKLP